MVLTICKEQFYCTVNFTHFNLYFKRKYVETKMMLQNFEIDLEISLRDTHTIEVLQIFAVAYRSLCRIVINTFDHIDTDKFNSIEA